jgi:hypothetical protein
VNDHDGGGRGDLYEICKKCIANRESTVVPQRIVRKDLQNKCEIFLCQSHFLDSIIIVTMISKIQETETTSPSSLPEMRSCPSLDKKAKLLKVGTSTVFEELRITCSACF